MIMKEIKDGLSCPKCGSKENRVNRMEVMPTAVYNQAEVFLAVECIACGCKHWDVELDEMGGE